MSIRLGKKMTTSIKLVLATVLLVLPCAVASIAALPESARLVPVSAKRPRAMPSGGELVSSELAVGAAPQIVAAADAPLDDDVMVVGVRLGGQARAYCLPWPEAGRLEQDVIVLDTLAGERVSIALSAHGNQVVVLRWAADGRRHRHPHQIVNWKAWRAAHPKTQVALTRTDVAQLPAEELRPAI
ncbi:MAG: hypothetical protein J5I93_08555 [Pirellulaceae bacterium]|nr:hypothetical protein [Pirellulaceae bacterium]